MTSRITIKRAQPNTHPVGKPFYTQVDGENVGEKSGMHYATKREVMAIARRYILAKDNLK